MMPVPGLPHQVRGPISVVAHPAAVRAPPPLKKLAVRRGSSSNTTKAGRRVASAAPAPARSAQPALRRAGSLPKLLGGGGGLLAAPPAEASQAQSASDGGAECVHALLPCLRASLMTLPRFACAPFNAPSSTSFRRALDDEDLLVHVPPASHSAETELLAPLHDWPGARAQSQ